MNKTKRWKGKRLFPLKDASEYINVSQKSRRVFDPNKIPRSETPWVRRVTVRKWKCPVCNHINELEWPSCRGNVTVNYTRDSFGNWKARLTAPCKVTQFKGGITFYETRFEARPIPEQKGKRFIDNEFVGKNTGDIKDQQELQALRELWSTEQHGVGRWGVDLWHFILYAETEYYKLKLFFHGKSYCWVEENYASAYAKRSLKYGSKELAVRAMEQDRIKWIERFSLAIPT